MVPQPPPPMASRNPATNPNAGPGRPNGNGRSALEDHPPHDAKPGYDEITPDERADGVCRHMCQHRGAHYATDDSRREKGQEDLPVEVAEPRMRGAGDAGGDYLRRVDRSAGDERRHPECREDRARGNAVTHADASVHHLRGESPPGSATGIAVIESSPFSGNHDLVEAIRSGRRLPGRRGDPFIRSHSGLKSAIDTWRRHRRAR